MSDHFEVRDADLAGRIGELTVPRAGRTVETPALLPVVNPNLETIAPARLGDEFGAEIIITNSYIVHGNDDLRERALSEGLHDLLDFDGAIMTDSGSFQLAEYGEIDVTTRDILQFQREIGSDVGTPVDVPTPPDVDRDRAVEELATTRDRLETASEVETGEMLVTGPIQGSTYPDLRERAAGDAAEVGFDVYPVGAVVPLMNDYRYDDVVDVVAAAKRGLGRDAPVHLFGAGHPMTFALAAALGCDLFDSAAYAIYARDDRYLTVRGTRHLDDLEYFPCSCPVCARTTPDELREMEDERRGEELAAHNLHVSVAEIRRIRQAIRAGNLLELVEARARSHPAVLEGYRRLLTHAEQLEREDPVSKGTFFYLSTESARRPEVRRYHDRIDRIAPEGSVLVSDGDRPDAGGDDRHGTGDDRPPTDDYDEVWTTVGPFGPVPSDLRHTYPFTAELPETPDRATREAAADGVAALSNAGADVTLDHGGWPEAALDRLPDDVEAVDRRPRPDESENEPTGTPGADAEDEP